MHHFTSFPILDTRDYRLVESLTSTGVTTTAVRAHAGMTTQATAIPALTLALHARFMWTIPPAEPHGAEASGWR
jgi:hypothetical protein